MNYKLNFHTVLKSLRLLSVGLVHMIFLAGCISSGFNSTTSVESLLANQSKTPEPTKDLNDKLFASVQDNSQDSNLRDYTLREGDLLQVTVVGEDELSTTARVGAEGTVTLPLIGSLTIKGLSVHELERTIEGAYGKKYLQDPHVTIFVKEQQGGKITLLGAVAKPGTYDYFSRQPLLNVLALGGGLTEKAGMMVQVRRTDAGSKRTSTFIVDLEDLIKNGEEQLNMEIEQGDVVFIPEAETVYVDGAIDKPGSYPIAQHTSVQEVIARAGGLAWYASDNVKLIRHVGKSNKEVIQLSAKDINASSLEVQDRDVIFVETNPVKQAVYGLRFSFFGTGIAMTPPK